MIPRTKGDTQGERLLDEALADSFPASDPPANTGIVGIGSNDHRKPPDDRTNDHNATGKRSRMATLTIDGLTLEVNSSAKWSTGGVQDGMPSAGYIEAQVRIPATILINDLDKTSAHIVMKIGGGRAVEGRRMRRVGNLRTNGELAMLRFEGDSVKRT
jgi:hypothetical protein